MMMMMVMVVVVVVVCRATAPHVAYDLSTTSPTATGHACHRLRSVWSGLLREPYTYEWSFNDLLLWKTICYSSQGAVVKPQRDALILCYRTDLESDKPAEDKITLVFIIAIAYLLPCIVNYYFINSNPAGTYTVLTPFCMH